MTRYALPNQRVAVGWRITLVIAAFLSPTGRASAEVKPASKPSRQFVVQPACMETARTQYELTACAKGSAADADKLLNNSYKAVLQYLCPDERALLVASERAWLAFRDADCAFWGGAGGTIAPMNEAICRADRSRERAQQLDGWPPNSARANMVSCK